MTTKDTNKGMGVKWLNLVWLVPVLLIMAVLGAISWLITRPLPPHLKHKVANLWSKR